MYLINTSISSFIKLSPTSIIIIQISVLQLCRKDIKDKSFSCVLILHVVFTPTLTVHCRIDHKESYMTYLPLHCLSPSSSSCPCSLL